MENMSVTGAELPYVIKKDKHGTEWKVIDLEHPDNCPRTGQVQIQAISKKNKRKGTKMPFKMVKDKLTGVLIGICTGIHPRTGDLDWLPIYIEDGTTFNREIRDEAQKCAVILRSTLVEGSPNVSEYGKITLFRVYDEEVAAVKTIKKIQAGQKAVSIAQSLHGQGLKDMAMNLGISINHSNHTILHSQVMKTANDEPELFLSIYENPNREALTIFNKGYNMGVITFDAITGYLYKGIQLGLNEVGVCQYFKDQPHVMASIEGICKDKENAQKEVAVKLDEKAELSRIIEEQAKQLEELKAKQEELLARANGTTTEPDRKLADLIARANAIGGPLKQGLKFYNNTPESIAKLEAKVLEAEANQTTA